MKEVLVTGSAGRLGKELVKLLKNAGYHVTGLDLVNSETTDVIGDILQKEFVEEITNEKDAVIHTAALHGKHYELNYPREAFIKVNIEGTHNLLAASVKNGIKKFIYTSTTSIYGKAMENKQQAVWVDEALVPQPRDIYDITKLTCELLCQDYFEKEGLETVVLRVSRFLPEEENTKANHRLYRGLDETDCAMAHLLALKKSLPKFEIFNISNDTPFEKEDLQTLYHNPKKAILKYFPQAEARYQQKNWQFPNCIDRVYSIAKAKKLLGYQPQNNFDKFI